MASSKSSISKHGGPHQPSDVFIQWHPPMVSGGGSYGGPGVLASRAYISAYVFDEGTERWYEFTFDSDGGLQFAPATYPDMEYVNGSWRVLDTERFIGRRGIVEAKGPHKDYAESERDREEIVERDYYIFIGKGSSFSWGSAKRSNGDPRLQIRWQPGELSAFWDAVKSVVRARDDSKVRIAQPNSSWDVWPWVYDAISGAMQAVEQRNPKLAKTVERPPVELG